MDWISGGGWNLIQMFNGNSHPGKMDEIESGNYLLRAQRPEGMGGHYVDTYADDMVNYFRSKEVPVNIVDKLLC